MTEHDHPPGADPDEEPTGLPEVDDPHGSRAEALEAELGTPPPEPPRAVTDVHRPSTVGGVIYLAVLAVAVVGVGIAASGSWRAGVSTLGGALLAAAAARLVLREDDAGMLQVRRKSLDAALLLVMGSGLIALAITIPNQPGT